MKRFKFLAIFFLLIALSCSKKDRKIPPANDYNRGQISILTDDSFKSVTNALADAYMINYPETHIAVKVLKEDLGLLQLLKEKAKLIVMSREMTKKEISEYERITDLKYNPAKFAADAVVFVVPASSARTQITLQEISSELKNGQRRMIFNGTNSGNINFVAQKLKLNPAELQFSIIDTNEEIITHLSQNPDKIGVISLNTISREYNANTAALKSRIKILPVVDDKNNAVLPEPQNLRDMSYAFTRIIYFLGNEGNFQLANGIMRFSATQVGQMVVEKEGLQPYNMYRREVKINE